MPHTFRMDTLEELARTYESFAEEAAESPCFQEWALGVATDVQLREWIAKLPPHKWQPNLVFAAARWNGLDAPSTFSDLRTALLSDTGAIRKTILDRSTQTNEVGRLATLAPVFSRIQSETNQPLALVEAGASAGLCLYPDQYSYSWMDPQEAQKAAKKPLLTCKLETVGPLPTAMPEISWRGGIDLNPLDVQDADAMSWLSTLVWPEQETRRQTLLQAIEIACLDPPNLVKGDILNDLEASIDEASQFGTVVVFHSAVIAYLSKSDRIRFQRMMLDFVARGMCRWVSNEAISVLPEITATALEDPPVKPSFVMALDGKAVAWTHGHGASMKWFG